MTVAPLSHGDVTGEYLALRRGTGLAEHLHELVWARGADAVEFLDGLLSQSVAGLGAGEAARSLLLSPQGKLRATLLVLAGGDRVGLLCDAGVGERVVSDLSRFKLRVDVTLGIEARPVFDLWGPGARELLDGLGILPGHEPGWVEAERALVAAVPFLRSSLPRFVVATNDAESLIDAGAVRVGALAATAVRVEAGEPVMGLDVDERTIPQEAGVVEASVDFTKGCYLGQELVARIDSRGHVNRHLRGVIITENILPPEGAGVFNGEVLVGTLSSVAESLDLRAPVALALLRREVAPGDRVEIRWRGGEAAARVAALPLIDGQSDSGGRS